MYELFLSAGIDVGADFSYLSIALPNQSFVGKPFRITHANLNSLEKTVAVIREAEQTYCLQSRILLESTGIYHYPLMSYLKGKGFCVSVVNPIITKGSANINIRKVRNDKFDSKKVALLGLKPDLKTSVIPTDLVLSLRNLVRAYYSLVDERSAYINRLTGTLKTAFPQYIGIFSKLTVETSLVLLEKYASPQAFLKARKSSVIKLIKSTARFGQSYAETQYNKIISAAKDALVFGYAVPSNFDSSGCIYLSSENTMLRLKVYGSQFTNSLILTQMNFSSGRFILLIPFPAQGCSRLLLSCVK